MTAPLVRLYGLPGAEVLYASPDLLVEHALAPEEHPVGTVLTVEVWDTHPPTAHLPEAAGIAEWIAEWSAENGEGDEEHYEQVAAASTMPHVLAAAAALVEAIALMVNRRMAKERLITLDIVRRADGEWYVGTDPKGSTP